MIKQIFVTKILEEEKKMTLDYNLGFLKDL